VRLPAITLWAWGLALAGGGCSGNSGAAVVASLDGGADAAPGFDAAVVPPGCMNTLLVPGDQSSCRADWRCGDGRSFSYVCGAAGDGGSRCYCITGSGVTAPLDGDDGCGQGEQALLNRAPLACQWDFSSGQSDGGDQ